MSNTLLPLPSPAAVTRVSVCLSLQLTDKPLFQVSKGIYDPSANPPVFTALPDLYTEFAAKPVVGQRYGILFATTDAQGKEVLQTMISAVLMESVEMSNDIQGWFRFQQDDDPYNLLTWLGYASLASDDLMWGVECPIEALDHFFEEPVKWVEGLNELADFSFAAPAVESIATSFGRPTSAPPATPITLRTPFNVQVVRDPNRILPVNRVHIEGVSGTAIVRVVVAAQAGQNTENQTNPLRMGGGGPGHLFYNSYGDPKPIPPDYWTNLYQSLQKTGETPTLMYDPANNRAFGHIKIYDPEFEGTRQARVSDYLTARTTDPAGYVGFLNMFKEWKVMQPASNPSSNASQASFQDLSQAVSPSLNGASPTMPVSFLLGPNISFTYASQADATGECCDIQFGSANPQNPQNPSSGLSFTVDSGTTKDY